MRSTTMATTSRSSGTTSSLPDPPSPKGPQLVLRIARAYWLVALALVLGLVIGNAVHSDAGLGNQVRALQATVDRLNHDNASLQAQLATVQSQVSDLQGANSSLESNRESLAAQLKAKAPLPKLVAMS